MDHSGPDNNTDAHRQQDGIQDQPESNDLSIAAISDVYRGVLGVAVESSGVVYNGERPHELALQGQVDRSIDLMKFLVHQHMFVPGLDECGIPREAKVDRRGEV